MNRHCSNPEDPICRMGCAGNGACRFAVLSYIAPMQCGEKERAELARLRCQYCSEWYRHTMNCPLHPRNNRELET
jgi:hypothetical protein